MKQYRRWGGRGRDGISAGLREQIIAMCDVDPTGDGRKTAHHIERARVKFPDARLFTDRRRLFDAKLELDAVWIAVPDHNHFPAAYRAIDAGLAVFCEKPLTWSAYEARTLAKVATEKGAVTQMGNQGHAREHIRLLCEYVWQGTLGEVTEAHVRTGGGASAGLGQEVPVPEGLNWDAWLGPAAYRDYQEGIHPYKWRGWLDYGTGTLGDWFCHNADGAVWALKLDQAETVEVESDTPPKPPGHAPDCRIVWHFPRRAGMPPCKLVWGHGAYAKLEPSVEVPELALKATALYVGSKGVAISGTWMNSVRLVPEEFQEQVGRPERVLPRVKGIELDFLDCVRTGGRPCSHFGTSGRLTEIMHLGHIAMKVGEKLTYNFRTGRFVNSDKANALLTREPRKGWEFGYV